MAVFSDEDLRRQGERDLREKIRLERALTIDLRRIFFRIRQDLRDTYVANGSIVPANNYATDITAALQRQYRRVANTFSDDIFDDLLEETPDEQKTENREIAVQEEAEARGEDIIPFILVESQRRANFIVSTTQNDINDAFASARAEQLNQDQSRITPIDEPLAVQAQRRRATVATLAAAAFAAQSANRPQLISQTETQNAAESSKLSSISQAATSELVIEGEPANQQGAFKVWNTNLDGRERESHNLADGQRVPVGSAFTVQGERLNYPGDTSLGASLSNIINCRCWISFENEP